MNLTYKIIFYEFPNRKNSVQAGVRPAFVVKDFEDGHMLLAAVTTKDKPMPTHVHIPMAKTGLHEDSVIMMEQLFWVEYDPHFNPVVIGDLHGNRTLKSEIDARLNTSLGLLQEAEAYGKASPQINRGDIFSNAGKEMVVLQNDVGNYFSPTTIIGDIHNERIASIRTVSRNDLLAATLKGRKRNVSRQIRELIS